MRATMKVTTLLQRQHGNLLQLCHAVEGASASIRASLLPQLAGDLIAHITVEERLFYPWVARALGDETWVRRANSRRALARGALERAVNAPVDGDEFAEAIGDLRGILEVHAKEQETTLFPLIERAITPGAMRELAHAMMKLYDREVELGYPSEREPVVDHWLPT
jgi:Hemerythrin HHE cation binding domain